ncbi:MAG: large repetitive protein [Solirubrobacteraceae bacterium]|nr:large repetitive protein [Solirubrobacteraceae bacterium]
MGARRSLAAVLTAGALWLVPATGAQAARAVHVSCGETITADTKLANDLIDCPRFGIVIGAAGITLDLNGHTIDGDDTPFKPCPEDEPCDVGIVNSGIRDGTAFNGTGYDGVTIENGTVTQFTELGVYVLEARDNRVLRLRTSKSDLDSDGVHFTACGHCRIEDSSASAYNVGFIITRSHDVLVQRNVVSANRFAGVLVERSDHVTVAANTAFDHPDGDGILIDGGDHNVARDNRSSRNGGGIGVVGSSDNLLTGNVLHDNRFAGAYLLGAGANRIERNLVSRNGDGSEGGIHLLSDDDGESSDHNVIAGNVLDANVGDGLLVDPGQTQTLVQGNLAQRNSDDGIDVDSSATTLTANIAMRNRDLGIEAVAGVADGGANVAHGNGNPLQCTYVFCL